VYPDHRHNAHLTGDQVTGPARPALGLVYDLRQLRDGLGPDPAPGSVADRERESFSRRESVVTLDGQADLLVQAALDNLEALDRLVAMGDMAVAPWVCARASLESCSLAVWLLDPRIGIQERVGRSLALRYETLRSQEKMANVAGEPALLEAIRTRINEVETVAVELGFTPLRNRSDQVAGIAVPRPPITSLVSMLTQDQTLYRILSGIAHSDTRVIRGLCFTPTGAAGPDGIVMVRAPARPLQERLVARVAAACSKATWELLGRLGAEAGRTAVVLEARYNELSLGSDPETRFWRTGKAQH
jgi:hypothetical protein